MERTKNFPAVLHDGNICIQENLKYAVNITYYYYLHVGLLLLSIWNQNNLILQIIFTICSNLNTYTKATGHTRELRGKLQTDVQRMSGSWVVHYCIMEYRKGRLR
jgi:hypothetical protein